MKEPIATEKDTDLAKARRRRARIEGEAAAFEPGDSSGAARVPPELSAGQHAAVLTDRQLSHPANAARRAGMVSDLQRSMGNAYVQRVMGHIQREQGTPAAP
ncbi:MAG: hypothetical protein FJZ95_10745, partial [Chloroflexi bacterium]|nr:hypothetical protein [Chloroflexota bacterium]